MLDDNMVYTNFHIDVETSDIKNDFLYSKYIVKMLLNEIGDKSIISIYNTYKRDIIKFMVIEKHLISNALDINDINDEMFKPLDVHNTDTYFTHTFINIIGSAIKDKYNFDLPYGTSVHSSVQSDYENLLYFTYLLFQFTEIDIKKFLYYSIKELKIKKLVSKMTDEDFIAILNIMFYYIETQYNGKVQIGDVLVTYRKSFAGVGEMNSSPTFISFIKNQNINILLDFVKYKMKQYSEFILDMLIDDLE